ncbi:TonB-dependent receptor [Kaistella jeonii]|uniref:TonB-dependent receptor n=1 Tax=Kaistella jeonii TaxID=266749 RepID=A0A0C1CWX4_9FLAO|nr:TonB-dependent receptor [Kaistella jeonii]KIA88876.1 TonB-dependent receptor [Kaistella jeonii]SFC12588.1 Outer membrane receptor proteins, mostly Fe transport [Kaistella jeonii]VEI94494.1 Outer membrane cobalamin receptor protein [Kaistella jeonii]
MTNRIEISSIIKKRTLGLAFVLGAVSLAFAQQKVSVNGKIMSKQNIAVPYASVTFSNKANKLYSDAVLSDDKGIYKLDLTPGNYDITIEAIDFKKTTLNKQISAAADLGNFTVEAESSVTGTKTSDIQGVVITGQAVKAYRVEIDKKVYDPSLDIVAKGGNLQDVLANVPSVDVDTDGTVSMRGNTNVRFLINGKPSSMLGIDDGADALKSIPADQIDRIEVITNPSSKYEASGTAGILNIILKKSKKIGFNGSIEGTLGYLPTTRLNTNLSWRKGAWTYYINGGGGYNRSKSTNNSEFNSFLNPQILNDGFSLKSIQDGTNKSESKNYNVTTGFLVDVTDKSTLNASVMFRNFNNESTGNTNYFDNVIIKDSAATGYPNVPFTLTNQFTNRLNVGTNVNNSFQADLGYDQKIGDKGQLISLATSYQKSKSEGTSFITENGFDNKLDIPTLTLNNILTKTENSTFLAKADYELPIGTASKIEAGARFDSNKNDYDYYVDESKNNAPTTILPNFTSKTFYNENIFAGYAQFKSKISNFGYQLGLRAENTDINVNFKRISDAVQINVNKNYLKFFPSVFLSYDLNKNNQLLLNYSRRINRPRSFFLIPFMSYNNNRNLFSGNPDLNPTYENSFELGYNLTKSKVTFNPTLYLKKSEDEVNFYQYSGLDENNKTVIYTMPVNAGSETNYGLDVNATYDPFKWWKIMGSADLYGYNNSGNYQGFDFSGKGFSTRLRLTNTFKPTKTTSFQIQGFYRGAENNVSTQRKPMYAVNLGASQTIWKGNGTISFNIQDIFNTRARENFVTTPAYSQYSYMQWQPRQFSISLSYRFKQGDKIDQPKKKKDINSNSQGGDDQGPPM